MLRDLLIQIPIEEVFKRYVGGELKRRGNKLLAHCPWHGGSDGDKNPSLTIYKESNSWYCFGCGKGGSPIDLVMQSCGLKFKEAAKVMTKDFGITIGDEERAETIHLAKAMKLRRELKEKAQREETEAYNNLTDLYRRVVQKLDEIKTVSDMERLGGLYHYLSYLEYVLEILRVGNIQERLAVYQDDKVKSLIKIMKVKCNIQALH